MRSCQAQEESYVLKRLVQADTAEKSGEADDEVLLEYSPDSPARVQAPKSSSSFSSSSSSPPCCLLFETRDHNPTLDPQERERVVRDGGQLVNTGVEFRVFPGTMNLQQAREMKLTINMSRALGHIALSQSGVIGVPDIYEVHLEQEMPNRDVFVVCASDGIWDVMDNDAVMELIASSSSLEQVADDLVQMADTLWSQRPNCSGDNITVAIAKISGGSVTSSNSSS